jgi:hypothetical protein
MMEEENARMLRVPMLLLTVVVVGRACCWIENYYFLNFPSLARCFDGCCLESIRWPAL